MSATATENWKLYELNIGGYSVAFTREINAPNAELNFPHGHVFVLSGVKADELRINAISVIVLNDLHVKRKTAIDCTGRFVNLASTLHSNGNSRITSRLPKAFLDSVFEFRENFQVTLKSMIHEKDEEGLLAEIAVLSTYANYVSSSQNINPNELDQKLKSDLDQNECWEFYHGPSTPKDVSEPEEMKDPYYFVRPTTSQDQNKKFYL